MTPEVNNASERSARDGQELFGHISSPQTLDQYLSSTYSPESIKYRRYKRILSDLFPVHAGNVLELGAGAGDLSLFCMSLFPENRYFISELSIKHLEKHAGRTAEFFKVDVSKAKLLEVEAEHIPFEDKFFSVVLIKAAVHHFENPARSFGEIHRVLKQGGSTVH